MRSEVDKTIVVVWSRCSGVVFCRFFDSSYNNTTFYVWFRLQT